MKLSKDSLVCNSLLFAVIVYYCQQAIGLPNIIGQMLLVFILTVSIVYIPKILLNRSQVTNFILVWFIFVFYNILMYITTSGLSDINILKSVMLNFFPFFPFYYFSKKGILNKNKLIIFLFVVLPFFILNFYQSVSSIKVDTGKEDVVSNSIYFIMGLFPFVLLIKNKIVSLLLTTFLIYFMIDSNKRVAVLIGFLSFTVLIFKDVYIESLRNKIKQIFISMVILLLSYPFIYNIYTSNETIVNRVNLVFEGDTAGRDDIINEILNIWYNSDSAIVYIFGLGYNSTLTYVGHDSHNDWADMLTSFGIVGLMLYVILLISMISILFKSNWNKDKKVIFVLFLLLALVISMTSRWYWSSFAYINFLLLPYLIATRKDSL
ncbi:hypothetical protein ACTXGK_13405 [Psychrobacter sp. T6-5]|uniref:hypothetical protein n=1 Tax=Psychrobacter sp. T6-5 TaxID=3457451 RepID=UPI003FD0ED32